MAEEERKKSYYEVAGRNVDTTKPDHTGIRLPMDLGRALSKGQRPHGYEVLKRVLGKPAGPHGMLLIFKHPNGQIYGGPVQVYSHSKRTDLKSLDHAHFVPPTLFMRLKALIPSDEKETTEKKG